MKITSKLIGLSLLFTNSSLAAQAPVISNLHKFAVTPPIGWNVGSAESTKPGAGAMAGAEMSFVEPEHATEQSKRPAKETNKQFLERIKKDLNASDATSFRTNILIQVKDTKFKTVKEYAAETLKKSKNFPTYKNLGDKPTKLANSEAIDRISAILVNGMPLKTHEILCMKNGKIYSISLASSTSSFARNDAVFVRVVNSFTWR